MYIYKLLNKVAYCIVSGTHEELTKDPEGAYSQLIRLQEGRNEFEEVSISENDQKQNWSSAHSDKASLRDSMRRSMSRGSSGSRQSFTLNYTVPGLVNFQEEEEQEEEELDESEKTQERLENRRKVSIWRLAKLNKPELPVLLLGTVAAGVHGVIFPIFGLLLSSAIKMFYEPPHQLRKDSRFWALIYLGLGFVTLVAIPIQNFFFGVAGGKLIRRIRYLTFQKVVHQEISWFDDASNSRFFYHNLQLLVS